MLQHTFELNCIPIDEGSNLKNLNFQEFVFSGDVDTRDLRKNLTSIDVLWYRSSNKIYFLGQQEILRNALVDEGLTISENRQVEYREMFFEHRIALRFMLNRAFANFMYDKRLRPYFWKSYYPYFGREGDYQVSNWIPHQNHRIFVKYGLTYSLTLSPSGNVLLWVDLKNMTFIQYHPVRPIPERRSVFVFSPNQTCPCEFCNFLSHGAKTLSSDQSPDSIELIDCAAPDTKDLVMLQAKKNREISFVPYKWVFQTTSTKTLRNLGVYDRWRTLTLKPPPERYRLTWQILEYLSDENDNLEIEMPDSINLIFELSPIKFTREMRFLK